MSYLFLYMYAHVVYIIMDTIIIYEIKNYRCIHVMELISCDLVYSVSQNCPKLGVEGQ